MGVIFPETEVVDRAYTYWRITGKRIDVELIQSYLRGEIGKTCLGQTDDCCDCQHCRWNDLCIALMHTPQVGETLWMDLQNDGES
jgi:hypothetical protein